MALPICAHIKRSTAPANGPPHGEPATTSSSSKRRRRLVLQGVLWTPLPPPHTQLAAARLWGFVAPIEYGLVVPISIWVLPVVWAGPDSIDLSQQIHTPTMILPPSPITDTKRPTAGCMPRPRGSAAAAAGGKRRSSSSSSSGRRAAAAVAVAAAVLLSCCVGVKQAGAFVIPQPGGHAQGCCGPRRPSVLPPPSSLVAPGARGIRGPRISTGVCV